MSTQTPAGTPALQHLRPVLSDERAARATKLLKRNLTASTDWIVLNTTMDPLAEFAERDAALSAWLPGELEWLSRDRRKWVATRASRHLVDLPDQGSTRR